MKKASFTLRDSGRALNASSGQLSSIPPDMASMLQDISEDDINT
jgi:hypothetical protein